jgi:hypothetical protein
MIVGLIPAPTAAALPGHLNCADPYCSLPVIILVAETVDDQRASPSPAL